MQTTKIATKPNPKLRELKKLYRSHETKTLLVLRRRLKLLNALAAAKKRGVSTKELGQRYKTSPAQIRKMLAEHVLYQKDELTAAAILFEGQPMFSRLRLPKARFWQRMHGVLRNLETEKGLSEALKLDPQHSTFDDFPNRLLVISDRVEKKTRGWD